MKDNKLIIITLIKFFGVYAVLTVIYNYYLSFYASVGQCDIFTISVTQLSVKLSNLLGINASYTVKAGDFFTRYLINGINLTRVIEGCNAISVIILFISFIIAFSRSFKTTALFIISGTIILIVMNIIRISLINYIYYKFPEYAKFSHDYLFPMIIYGTVVVLWFVWIKYFLIEKK